MLVFPWALVGSPFVSQHEKPLACRGRRSNDLTYGTLPTGADSPSLLRVPRCTRVLHANKRHACPPDADSIIVPREIKRPPNMCDPLRYGQLRLSCSSPFPVENSDSASVIKSANFELKKEEKLLKFLKNFCQGLTQFEKSRRTKRKEIS